MAILNKSTRHGTDFELEPKAVLRVWLVALAWLLGTGWNLPAEMTTSKEYQVKAAFLYNFAQFVEWPETAFSETQNSLVIGIVGEDPFGACLDEIVRGEKVNNHPLVIQRYRRIDDIKNCHILFVSQSETKHLEEILAGLKHQNILTVGDFEGFAKRGGMIRFLTEQNKIRFRVNLEAVKSAGLTISSKLLKASEIVAPGKD